MAGVTTKRGTHSDYPGMVRADLVTGIVLTALGIAALIACLDMPRFEERQINPYTVPGLVPGMIAAIIILLGFSLTLRALKQGAVRLTPSSRPSSGASGTGTRLVLTLSMTLLYAAGLVGRLPFWLATGLFVFAFVALLEWRQDRTPTARIRALTFAAVYAVAVATLVTFVFQEIFLVRLP